MSKDKCGRLAIHARTLLTFLCLATFTCLLPSICAAQPALGTQAAPGSAPLIAAQAGPSDSVRAILLQFGTFVQNAKYGEVWTPTVTPPGWHPYEACHWVNTRKYGWYFDDVRPWGQIVHHYGRWTHDDAMGWIWIPGKEFSPGWVVWRSSPQWIGWAPQLPDEDMATISADQFNNGGFWTFLDVNKFAQGCTGDQVVALAQIPVVLQQTQFVTEIDRVADIAIFVLPNYIVGPLVNIDVAFQPWSPAFYFQLMIDLNAVFNELDVVVSVHFVDCTRPAARPVTYVPSPAPPPGLISPPAPPVAQNRCADGSAPPCRQLPPPVLTCPRGSHVEGTGCVANFTPPCPDGTPRDPFGRCATGAPPFVCANGSPPDGVTGLCAPAVVSATCRPPLILRNGLCIMAGPSALPPLCPNGSPADPQRACPSTVSNVCLPPRVVIGGACTDRTVAASCLPPQTMSNGRCVDRVVVGPACLPPRTIVGGQCTDRVAQPSCAPPQTMRNGQCVSPLPVAPACSQPSTLVDGRCVAAVVPRSDPPPMRGANGPFDGGIRHPTYGSGQNGNLTVGAVARPPALPVLQRSPQPAAALPTPMPLSGPRMPAGPMPTANAAGSGSRPPVVLSRGGGGQNMFKAAPMGGSARMAVPQPVMHQMPSPGPSAMSLPRGGGTGSPQIR